MLGAVALIGALGVVFATKAVYSAIFLATTMIILAIFYVAQGALFLGVVQVVVYTGAVMMLFLFVVMMLDVDFAELKAEQIAEQAVEAVDGTQTKATSEDIMDEFVRIETEVDADPIDEDDEEQIDMDCVSVEMLEMFS